MDQGVLMQWAGEAALVTFHIATSGRRALVLEKRYGDWKIVHPARSWSGH